MTGPPALVVRETAGGTVVAARVAVATGFWDRFRGLMGRPALAEGEGLFLPDSSIHMCFMRFAIDALFVSAPDGSNRRRVVELRHELPPWKGLVLPVKGAAGVVELPAGTLRSAGLQPGDEVWLGPVDGSATGAATAGGGLAS